MEIQFLGAAQEVTGSRHLVAHGDTRFLVDCGLFQGGREADAKNRQPLLPDAARIDFVLLTHAHLDHSGWLPKLAGSGFRGPIYATPATADLLEVMLADSAHVIERESESRHHARRRPVPPLYTLRDVGLALDLLRRVDYDVEFSPASNVRARFRDAGHILGAAFIEVQLQSETRTTHLLLSGDIGQPGHPVVKDPATPRQADVAVVESTYGNRLHKSMDETVTELIQAVSDTIVNRRGNVIVPAFAVGRTQDLLVLLIELQRAGRLPRFDIFVDSPMATAATQVTMKHLELVDQQALEALRWMRGHAGHSNIRFVEDIEESRALYRHPSGALIISASGMCDAGRIKHHLARNLPRPECSVIFTGFQAGGTLGRRIIDGANTVRIYGEDVPVQAKIHTIGGLSAHADRDALLDWLGHLDAAPRQLFVVHGEADTAQQFAQSVRDRFRWPVTVPEPGSLHRLGDA
jgi:metallo-beta-lactamase family protein